MIASQDFHPYPMSDPNLNALCIDVSSSLHRHFSGAFKGQSWFP